MQSEAKRRRAVTRAPGGGTRAAVAAGGGSSEEVQWLARAPRSPKWARREQRHRSGSAARSEDQAGGEVTSEPRGSRREHKEAVSTVAADPEACALPAPRCSGSGMTAATIPERLPCKAVVRAPNKAEGDSRRRHDADLAKALRLMQKPISQRGDESGQTSGGRTRSKEAPGGSTVRRSRRDVELRCVVKRRKQCEARRRGNVAASSGAMRGHVWSKKERTRPASCGGERSSMWPGVPAERRALQALEAASW